MEQNLALAFVNSGNDVKVQDIKGNESMVIRLREMGFINGNIIKMIKNDVGPLILGVGESRIILSRGMATKILVSEM